MEEETKSNLEHENLNESSNQSTGKLKMPWQNKFGEDENLKNRQYSRSARNQPTREATTLSKVLLFLVVLTCLVPFIIFIWVNASKSNQTVTPRTASVVQASMSSAKAESSAASSSVSQSSQSMNVTTNAISSETSQSSNTDESQEATSTTRRNRRAEETTQETTQTQAQTGGQTYVIQAGDSWYGVATKFGVDVYALAAANGASIDSTILPGQTIIIP